MFLPTTTSTWVIPGHGTAVAWPAVFALAERDGLSGRDVLAAYVAGFETVAAIGALVEPSHYDRGFHASATIGTFGAAAAAGRLLGSTSSNSRKRSRLPARWRPE